MSVARILYSYKHKTWKHALKRYGVTESLRREDTWGGRSLILLAAQSRVGHKLRPVVRALSGRVLKTSKGWLSSRCFGVFFPLIATLNLLFFQFKATTSCFPTTHHCEGPGSISLLACLWVLGLLCASAAISSPG